MGFYRFRSNVDICGNRISSGAKATLVDGKIKITRYSGINHEKILEMDKDKFFKEMETFPSMLNRMKENIKRRIKV